MLEENEVVDSFNSASRIQNSFLPSDDYINEVIPENFILYLPRDIISGDFYWIEEINDRVIFAVGDSTGHGVPGAIVRELCINSLDRSVKEFGMVIPGHILDKTREILVNKVQERGKGFSEGMDIALCSLIGDKLQYSGANNPLWIIHNGVLTEYEATKQPIGLNERPTPFTTEEVWLAKGDSIYLFSDGFKDQFGATKLIKGTKPKKFMSSRLKELLISIHKMTMSEQKDILEHTFMEWKGSNDQIDDVCIMGVRI